MNKLSYIYFLFGFLFFQAIFAQEKTDSLVMKLNLKFGKMPLELNQNYISKNDTLQINLFKFYISGISVNYSDKTTFYPTKNYHLIDIENPKSLYIPICKKTNKEIIKITFNVGIDSLTSVSGALSGDLDATKGMYWAWQSGYINMKIEGKSSSCKTRKNAFQFHIGGYLEPNYAMRKVSLIVDKKNQIDIVMDLEKLFSKIHLKETNSIMIPSKKAMNIADLLTKMFLME